MKKLIPFNFRKWDSFQLPIVNGKGEKIRILGKLREKVTYPVAAIVNETYCKTYTEFGRYIQYHPSDEDLFMVVNVFFVKGVDIIEKVKH